MARAFVRRKSLNEIRGLLLDVWLQALLADSKVPERVKGKSPLLLPRVAV